MSNWIAFLVEENVHGLVGSGQEVAVDAERLRRMGGRHADEQAGSHGQSAHKVFDCHNAPLRFCFWWGPPHPPSIRPERIPGTQEGNELPRRKAALWVLLLEVNPRDKISSAAPEDPHLFP